MNIGVAIVTHNNIRHIASCIEKIVRAGARNISIVDSASSDGTGAYLANLGYPHVVLGENRGFGYAANRAARMLNTEYVLFINPDTELQGGTLQKVVDVFERHDSVGVVGGLLEDGYGVVEKNSYGKEPTILAMMLRHVTKKQYGSQPFFADWVSGGALAIRKKIFDQVGGFDENFFLYWEDVDLCRRVREAGFSIMVQPQFCILHARGGSGLESKQKTLEYDRSADIYYRKHYPVYIWRFQGLLRSIYRLVRPLAR